ncbi:YqcI/YcgG family protein [Ornithinibacillus massiliensis]|uniref:YqcI/YcgG family protein n=1 Tax=Ornithinibacillus massiliensis TaxID=1944633 RepID=A0ABS5MFI4_9BACI|nr:YqcI/YcgG family protein [Ornithinibacillus massiliensis]
MIRISVLYQDSPTNRNNLSSWERATLEQFVIKMNDKEKLFPCIPATIGFTLNQLRYGFLGDPRKLETVGQLADLLKEFTNKSKRFGAYTSLILFFRLTDGMINSYTVNDYEQLFWQQLSTLTSVDGSGWPEDIPTDPHNPIWEFCFHDERYFVYCATPAHEKRQSRHFDTMMLAITPRWVLQTFYQSEVNAKKIKKRIRERLVKYDSIGLHPDLNSYGALDNYEWRQYFLRDDNTTLKSCPFHAAWNDLNCSHK